MAQATTDKPKSNKSRPGVPCDEKGLKEFEKTWQDMDDCFKLLYSSKKKR